MNSQVNVLYVDDEENNLLAFRASFRRSFNIFTAISAAEAKVILAENDIHVLISDQKMPGAPGIELLEEALKKYPDQVRILLTAYSDFEVLKKAVNKGYIFKYIIKPWDDAELKDIIKQAHVLYVKNNSAQRPIPEVESRKVYLEDEIKKLEDVLEQKKDAIEKFIDGRT